LSEKEATTRAHQLADQIREELLQQRLREGETFMTEADVAERFQVSRSIAREAVSRLRGLGILTSRQGKGLLVGRPNPVSLWERSIPFVGRSDEDLVALSQLRYVLEVGSADLCAANATEQQVERLEKLAEEFSRLRTKARGDEQENEIELAFHSLLLEMTGNQTIAGMHRVLSDYFQRASVVDAPSSEADSHAVWQHRAIAQAIRQRDAEQVRSLLRQHLRTLLEPPGTQSPAGR
jgi:DNA-binding FadR family transcriptional regulator